MMTKQTETKKDEATAEKELLATLDYYLDVVMVDLKHRRTDGLRSYGDHIAAIAHGFQRKSSTIRGRRGPFKRSCYATVDAFAAMQKTLDAPPVKIHMEHVVPIKVVGQELLDRFCDEGVNREDILKFLRDWIIPCVVTETEHTALLAAGVGESMSGSWKSSGTPDLWDRYKKAKLYKNVKRVSEDLHWKTGPELMHRAHQAQTAK
jgi:hypothetical protein